MLSIKWSCRWINWKSLTIPPLINGLHDNIMEVMLSGCIRILFTVYSLFQKHLELLIGRKEEVLQNNIIQIISNRRPYAKKKSKNWTTLIKWPLGNINYYYASSHSFLSLGPNSHLWHTDQRRYNYRKEWHIHTHIAWIPYIKKIKIKLIVLNSSALMLYRAAW